MKALVVPVSERKRTSHARRRMSEGDVNQTAGLLSASDILEAFSNCSLGDTLAKRLSGDLDHVTSTKDFSQASSEWLRCAPSDNIRGGSISTTQYCTIPQASLHQKKSLWLSH